MKRLSLIALWMAVCGCQTRYWYNPEVNNVIQVRRDAAACHIEASQSSNPLVPIATVFNGWARVHENSRIDRLTEDCMAIKGYSLVNRNEIPSGAPIVPE